MLVRLAKRMPPMEAASDAPELLVSYVEDLPFGGESRNEWPWVLVVSYRRL